MSSTILGGNGRPVMNAEEQRLSIFKHAVERLVENAIYSRREIVRRWMDPRREIDDECGYPTSAEMDGSKYRELWSREPIAARVVELMPRESWILSPIVYEDEDPDVATPFEEAWDELGNGLRGGNSHYKQERGSPIWEYLKRIDELSGIGHYGVLLLGFDDVPVDDWANPVKVKEGRKLLYLRPLDETLAAITRYETEDRSSPRFGMPTQYSITLANPNDLSQGGGQGSPESTTHTVHWSRVIHVADNLASSEIFGVPRLRPVLNPVLDIRKVRGSSGEMYYKGAFPGLSMETHPQLGGDVEIDSAKLKDEMEQFWNGLQRAMASSGMHAQMLAPTVVDPTPQIEVQIDAICIKLSCPKRIFMGSERGELASSQDERAWKGRVTERQTGYLTPRVIVPFVDRLIDAGVLPEPADGYLVEWPDIYSLSDIEKADVALKETQALAAYVGGSVEALVPPLEFLTHVMGMEDGEAQAILDSAEAHMEDAFADTEDETLVPGHVPTPPKEELPPGGPVKMGQGETLVTPDGKKLAATKPKPMAKNGVMNAGGNCGIGEDGFEEGNTCAKGGEASDASRPVTVGPHKAIDKVFVVGGFRHVRTEYGQKNLKAVGSTKEPDKGHYSRAGGDSATVTSYGEWRVRTAAGEFHKGKGKDDLKKYLTTANQRKLQANVFCPTGKDGGVDPTCSPGGAKGGLGQDASSSQSSAVLAIRKRAEGIRFTDDVVSEGLEGITRRDIDEIEERMTSEEQGEMSDRLDSIRDSAVDEMDVDVSMSNVDDEAGYNYRGVNSEVEELIEAHVEDEELLAVLKEVNDGHFGDRQGGLDGIDEIRERLEAAGAPPELVDAVNTYRSEAEEKIEGIRESMEQSQREQFEYDYDNSQDRRDYLREFYDDHQDEPRYSGEGGKGQDRVWGKDSQGDRVMHFSTSDGAEFRVNAFEQKAYGMSAVEVQFSDASGSFSITGKGGAKGAVEVFRTVSASVTVLIENDAPDVLKFSASEPSRQKLYDKLVDTVSKVNPGYASITVSMKDLSGDSGPKTYVVAKRELMPKIVEKIGQNPAMIMEVLVNRGAK